MDAKRAILRPAGFAAMGELIRAEAESAAATAVGGMTMGADAIACSALAAGADVKAFFVRKERKEHGLQRWIEGPPLAAGERCLIVEDVVTTGGSTVKAIERVREEGLEVAAVVSVLDRLAGGASAPSRRRRARPTALSPRSTTCIRTAPTADQHRDQRGPGARLHAAQLHGRLVRQPAAVPDHAGLPGPGRALEARPGDYLRDT